MRILFLAPYTPLLTKPRPYNFILHLAQQHEVHLLCFEDIPEAKLAEHPDYQKLKTHCQTIDRIPIPAYKIALNLMRGLLTSRKPLRVHYYGSNFAQERIQHTIERYKIDAIHVDRSRFAGLAANIDLPKILDLTDSISLYLRQCRDIAPLHFKPLYQLELNRMLRYEQMVGIPFNHCLITSALDRSQFTDSAYYDRIDVVPNAVDKAFFMEDIPQSETDHNLLFYGNLSYHPNVDGIKYFCTAVFPEIQKQVPDVKLHILGNKPARAVQYLEANPAIRVTGWVPSVIDYIAAASVVISPLRIGVGFPNKVAESMALGKAVVSTKVGCQGLPGSDKALLVAHNDAEFIDATTRLLQDKAYKKQVEKRAWDYARISINPAESLEHLDKLYGQLL